MASTHPPTPRRAALLLLALLPACALPLNTAVRDWSRTASLAVDHPELAPNDAARAMQEALATYFRALEILQDGAVLPFRPEVFASLAPRAPDAAAAITRLGTLLRAASDERPERWLPSYNSGPAPAYEDRRIIVTLEAADAPVQALLTALSGSAPPPYAQVLARVGEGHALLALRANWLTQRATEREIRGAEDRLLRALARLPAPPPGRRASPAALQAP